MKQFDYAKQVTSGNLGVQMISSPAPVKTDVLCVGGGIAALSFAYTVARRRGAGVVIIDKARQVGMHNVSGAVVAASSLRRLLGDIDLPFAAPIRKQRIVFLTGRRHLTMPAPPPIRTRSHLLVPYGRLCQFLAQRCEAAGAEVYTEMSATDPIIEDGRVCGVRLLTGEEVLANLTVLSEGVCGAVTRKVFQSKGFQADDRSDCYALGIKIVVEAPDDLSDGVVLSLVG